jgi:nickel-dependent lactate racemase
MNIVEIKLPLRGGEETVYLPSRNLLYVALPRLQSPPELSSEINRALDYPLGSDRLEKIVSPRKKIALLVDDITRPTPQKEILPLIVERILSVGVPVANITIVIGLGTHRCLTPREISYRFGKEIFQRFLIIQSDYREKEKFISLGFTPQGTPITIRQEVYQADIKISIGNIVPHPIFGWSGGAKMIQPGVCGQETTEKTHLAAGMQEVKKICGEVENPIRQEADLVTGRVGLDFIFNTVLDPQGRLLRAFAGDFIMAHRAGVKFAEAIYRPEIPALADAVICSAYPTDIDYWQGLKALVHASLGVRPGRTIIFLIAAPEGLSGNAPEHGETLKHWANKDIATLKQAVEKEIIRDVIGAGVCMMHSQILSQVRVICVSSGLNGEDKRALGFEEAVGIQEALDKVFHYEGRDARVGVIPYGGETLVKYQ